MRPHMGQNWQLVLASASPRRRELLAGLGVTFEVSPADVDERVHPGEDARAYVRRVAREKAAKAAQGAAGKRVLAADTSVVLDDEVLGKPSDAEDAKRMLRRLSGRAHWVFTAVALDGPSRDELLVETRVHFRELTEGEIAWYVSTGEPLDKAGAYGIQGRAGMFVERIEGSPSNVIGLPLAETVALLERAGHPLPFKTEGSGR